MRIMTIIKLNNVNLLIVFSSKTYDDLFHEHNNYSICVR